MIAFLSYIIQWKHALLLVLNQFEICLVHQQLSLSTDRFESLEPLNEMSIYK